ncbi:hypothetical protein STENM223S_05952 [Streptomyces tendae]
MHGLVLGTLGPLRRGGAVRHLGRFTTEGVARELNDGATMLFGVPTMYHRIAEALPAEPDLVRALSGAGCWCRARPRCRCTTTSGSRRRPAPGSSSGTA